MAIDLASETIMSLKEAAAWMRQHLGSTTTYSTLNKYAKIGRKAGRKRIKLEVVIVAGGMRTSVQAIERFADALTRAKGHGSTTVPADEPTRRAKSERDRAERICEEAGF